MQFSNMKTILTSFRYQKTSISEKYFKLCSLLNSCAIRDISFRKTFLTLHFLDWISFAKMQRMAKDTWVILTLKYKIQNK